jgi:hypothetical protein
MALGRHAGSGAVSGWFTSARRARGPNKAGRFVGHGNVAHSRLNWSFAPSFTSLETMGALFAFPGPARSRAPRTISMLKARRSARKP